MSVEDFGFLATFVLVGAGWVSIGLWWFAARSTWLSRLSARGKLRGHYTPYRGTAWGSPGWLFRQRLVPSDVLGMERFAAVEDDDRVTELWRVRMVRRSRLVLATAPLVLVLPFLVSALLDRYGAALVFVLVALALAFAIPARRLYRRARNYGEVADIAV